MAVGVGASGFVGIAAETTSGTYLAPTHYMLLRSESLNYVQDSNERRPLRGIADIAGLLAGNSRVEGDIEVELTEDLLPQILRSARVTQVKAGTAPFTYTITPSAVAVPAKTMSITVVRNGIVFGYTGCVVASQKYSLDDGLLVGTFSIVGSDEATQSLPTPTYVTTVPYSTGTYQIQIPTTTTVFDTDTFDISIEDNAEPQYRLKNTGRGAQFVKYGERSVEVSVERDFESRTEYDQYKAMTSKSIQISAIKDANSSIVFLFPASIVDTYEIAGLSGQADLIRASITYKAVYDSTTSKAYQILVTTNANITVP